MIRRKYEAKMQAQTANSVHPRYLLTYNHEKVSIITSFL